MDFSDDFTNKIQKTIELLDTIKPLDVKNVDNKFQNGHTNWEKYLDLYKKCYENFCSMKGDYKEALEGFRRKFNSLDSLDEESNKLGTYSIFLRSYINRISDSIRRSKSYNDMVHKNLVLIVSRIYNFVWRNIENKMLVKSYEEIYDIKFSKGGANPEEIIGNFENSILGNITGSNKGKSVLLGKFNEIRKNLKVSLEYLSTEFSQVKEKAMNLLKMSSKNFVNRNVLQNSENAPIQVLSKFYLAIRFGKVLPCYGINDLLKVPKGFDIKIKSSMEKAVRYFKKLDDKIDRSINMQDLEKNTQDLLKTADIHRKTMSNIIERIEKLETSDKAQTAQISSELDRLCSAIESVPKVLGVNDEPELISLLSKALSCDLACNVICDCFVKLNKNVEEILSTKFENEDMIKLLFDQNPGKLKSILVSSIGIFKFILQINSLASGFMRMFSENIGHILKSVAQQRVVINNTLDLVEKIL